MLVYIVYRNREGDTLLNLAVVNEVGVFQHWAPEGTTIVWEGKPKVIFSQMTEVGRMGHANHLG